MQAEDLSRKGAHIGELEEEIAHLAKESKVMMSQIAHQAEGRAEDKKQLHNLKAKIKWVSNRIVNAITTTTSKTWEGLSQDQRKICHDEAFRRFVFELGEAEFAILDDSQKNDVNLLIWAGCCMHKEITNDLNEGAFGNWRQAACLWPNMFLDYFNALQMYRKKEASSYLKSLTPEEHKVLQKLIYEQDSSGYNCAIKHKMAQPMKDVATQNTDKDCTHAARIAHAEEAVDGCDPYWTSQALEEAYQVRHGERIPYSSSIGFAVGLAYKEWKKQFRIGHSKS